MKKMYVLFGMLLLLFFVMGCQAQDSKTDTTLTDSVESDVDKEDDVLDDDLSDDIVLDEKESTSMEKKTDTSELDKVDVDTTDVKKTDVDNLESDVEDKTDVEDTSQPELKEIEVIAKKWDFEPNPIEVNKGDKVNLKIISIDVNHGIMLTEFNINEFLSPGNTVEVEFVADKVGEFPFWCNVACGSGHSSMRGTLVVK